jgi:hypothetical protein
MGYLRVTSSNWLAIDQPHDYLNYIFIWNIYDAMCELPLNN